MAHYHTQPPDATQADAIWPKMNADNPPLFPGHIGQCECGKLMFWPKNRALRPTEVEKDPIL
jgi:hypothetical protein